MRLGEVLRVITKRPYVASSAVGGARARLLKSLGARGSQRPSTLARRFPQNTIFPRLPDELKETNPYLPKKRAVLRRLRGKDRQRIGKHFNLAGRGGRAYVYVQERAEAQAQRRSASTKTDRSVLG